MIYEIVVLLSDTPLPPKKTQYILCISNDVCLCIIELINVCKIMTSYLSFKYPYRCSRNISRCCMTPLWHQGPSCNTRSMKTARMDHLEPGSSSPLSRWTHTMELEHAACPRPNVGTASHCRSCWHGPYNSDGLARRCSSGHGQQRL